MNDKYNSLEFPASEDSALLIQIQDWMVSSAPGEGEKRMIPDGVRNISPGLLICNIFPRVITDSHVT